MVEVVRPMIMANAIHQDLQRTYFSIRFLLFQNPVTQMHALSYRYPLRYTVIASALDWESHKSLMYRAA